MWVLMQWNGCGGTAWLTHLTVECSGFTESTAIRSITHKSVVHPCNAIGVGLSGRKMVLTEAKSDQNSGMECFRSDWFVQSVRHADIENSAPTTDAQTDASTPWLHLSQPAVMSVITSLQVITVHCQWRLTLVAMWKQWFTDCSVAREPTWPPLLTNPCRQIWHSKWIFQPTDAFFVTAWVEPCNWSWKVFQSIEWKGDWSDESFQLWKVIAQCPQSGQKSLWFLQVFASNSDALVLCPNLGFQWHSPLATALLAHHRSLKTWPFGKLDWFQRFWVIFKNLWVLETFDQEINARRLPTDP